jgi:hypothetical protein
MTERSGDLILLVLILSLVAFLYVFVFTVYVHLRGEDWRTLVVPVARLTHSAFLGLGALVAIGAYRRGRNGWWVYLVAAVLPVVQVLVPVLWFGRTRQREARLGRLTL